MVILQKFRQLSQLTSIPGNKRSPAANMAIAIGIIGALVMVAFFSRERKKVVSVDAVLNAQLLDVKAPEEGVLQPLSSVRKDDLLVSRNSYQDAFCASQQEGQKVSLANNENPASNNQVIKSGEDIELGQSLNPDTLLFRLRNERYSDLSLKLAKGRLCEIESELMGVIQQQETNLELKSQVSIRAETQLDLEVLEQQALRGELERDLASARERKELAKRQLKRIRFLFNEGASAEVDLTDSQDVLEQRNREVETLEARLKILEANEEAARARLSLSRTPSNYDPFIWLRELDIKIERENHKIRMLEERLRTAKEELIQTSEDVGNKQFIDIKSPQQGKVRLLKLMAYPGKLVQPGEVLGQVAVCDNLWVDAWVEESTAQTLAQTRKAVVTLNGLKENGKDIKLEGEVDLIRSGIGRLVTDSDAAVQIDANQAIRYAQVRIASIDVAGAKTIDENSGLCDYIGYSGKVTFPKEADHNIGVHLGEAESSSREVASNRFSQWLSVFIVWLQYFPFSGSE